MYCRTLTGSSRSRELRGAVPVGGAFSPSGGGCCPISALIGNPSRKFCKCATDNLKSSCPLPNCVESSDLADRYAGSGQLDFRLSVAHLQNFRLGLPIRADIGQQPPPEGENAPPTGTAPRSSREREDPVSVRQYIPPCGPPFRSALS